MNLLKKLVLVLIVTLAINFIALIAAGAMLAQRAQLDRGKIEQVREVLFSGLQESTEAEAPAEPQEPTPMEQLVALLDAESGRGAEERVGSISRTLDDRAVALSRIRRELSDRSRQLDAAAKKLASERQSFDAKVEAWRTEVEAATARAADEGYQKSLELYEQLQARQVKNLFLGLEDDVVLAYLRDMDPAAAAKVLKEFKTDEEADRARRILEKMRQGEEGTAVATAADGSAGA